MSNFEFETGSGTDRPLVGTVTDPAIREAVFAVRMIVFVEEQAVPPEEELDTYDLTATHFYVTLPEAVTDSEHTGVIGTARVIDKGHGTAKIGRVAVLKPYRGRGLGNLLMRYIHEHSRENGFAEAMLEAQLHAIPFYEKLGYVAEGDIFLDAGIEHRVMRRPL